MMSSRFLFHGINNVLVISLLLFFLTSHASERQFLVNINAQEEPVAPIDQGCGKTVGKSCRKLNGFVDYCTTTRECSLANRYCCHYIPCAACGFTVTTIFSITAIIWGAIGISTNKNPTPLITPYPTLAPSGAIHPHEPSFLPAARSETAPSKAAFDILSNITKTVVDQPKKDQHKLKQMLQDAQRKAQNRLNRESPMFYKKNTSTPQKFKFNKRKI